MISLLQAPIYRAFPNNYRPAAYESALRLQNGCYVPRWELGPQSSANPVAARGYVSQVVRVKPGSWILGLYAGISQLTDLGSGLMFFDQPSEGPGVLPIPRLVSEPGELKLELWNDQGTAQDLGFMLVMAEPVQEVLPR